MLLIEKLSVENIDFRVGVDKIGEVILNSWP